MKLLKFTDKLLPISDLKIIFGLFLLWKITLFFILIFSLNFVNLAGRNFLGGGFENYISNPWLFAWANFDGEHYLSIAQIGYRGLEQAFFPVYPILLNVLTKPFDNSSTSVVSIGLLISNFSFLFSLIILYKLIILDFPKKIAYLTIICLLIFPTSFYFGVVYSESLFLLLSLLSFYAARKNKWFWASFFGIIASVTRIFGVLLLPALFLEAWQQKKSFRKYFWIFAIPLGLFAYMYYQWITVGDPLAFYHLQKIVGPQHESGITPLPQVYFRYIKMLLTTEISNPIYQTIILEFFVGVAFFLLPIYGYFKKIRLSYLFFALIGFLLPTIQGSFSSVPRYIIVFFPSFLSLAVFVKSLPLFVRVIVLVLFYVWLMFETAHFFRGYWVA